MSFKISKDLSGIHHESDLQLNLITLYNAFVKTRDSTGIGIKMTLSS